MSPKYRYGHRPGRRRRTRIVIVVIITLLIIGVIGGVVGYDIYKNRKEPVSGPGRTVVQTLDDSFDKLVVDDPLFSMELPGDWKELSRQNDKTENSITWQATKKAEDNRWLKIYIDIIPTTRSVNRMLPVMREGTGLSHGVLSENCVNFTQGAPVTSPPVPAKDTAAKWQDIDFICDLPRAIDNEVGTGSAEGINTVTVTGPAKGAHKYFFLFTDRNVQPNYTILYNAIKSFKAK